MAALCARPGGRTVVLPSTPRDEALGAGLQTGEQRACASSRRRLPLARAHSRVERGCAAPPGVSAAPPRAHPARVSPRPPWRRGAGR